MPSVRFRAPLLAFRTGDDDGPDTARAARQAGLRPPVSTETADQVARYGDPAPPDPREPAAGDAPGGVRVRHLPAVCHPGPPHGRPQVAELFEQVAEEEYFGHFAEQAREAGVIGMEAENLHLAI